MIRDGDGADKDFSVVVAGFGNPNTRGNGAGYQDRWAASSGPTGAWLAIADGIGGGPAGEEAAQVAIGLAQVVLGTNRPAEERLHHLFDSVFMALRPWWVRERAGGTTLTTALVSDTELWVAAVGDSPAYVNFGNGFELVTEPKQSHHLKEWLGSEERPHPHLARWDLSSHHVRGVLVASDGVDPEVLGATTSEQSVSDLLSKLQTAPPLGGDDASAAVAILTRR